MKAKRPKSNASKPKAKRRYKKPDLELGSKSAFIRSMPDATAVEVAAKAKEAGLVVPSQLVHNIRSRDRLLTERAAKEPSVEASALEPESTPSPPAMTPLEFIRSCQPHLSANEIVAKGEAIGIRFTPQMVYYTRKKQRIQEVGEAAPRLLPPPRTMTQAAFVRSRPMSMTVEQLIEAAALDGIALSPATIYQVRTARRKADRDRKAGYRDAAHENGNGAAKPPKKSKGKGKQDDPLEENAVEFLKALGAELGLGRAIEILEHERSLIRRVLDR